MSQPNETGSSSRKQSNNFDSSSDENIINELIRESELADQAYLNTLIPKKIRNKRRRVTRNREQGAIRLYDDYFAENPVYNARIFRRRYRMIRTLFDRVFIAVHEFDPFFHQKTLCTGEVGLSPLQKITVALRLLANGCSVDSVDEYIRIGESTTFECLDHFCRAVVARFSNEYLREPTEDDVARLLEENRQRGFPGMLGSVDCMHWKWKNCHKAWSGTYKNYKGHNSIVLEAVASHDLWIWHAFFRMPGSFNDINVLNRSGLFDRMLRGQASPVEYPLNNRIYRVPYYLGDAIYPPILTIVKTIANLQTEKEQHFAVVQEALRKDVEREFGAFQGRWGIIRQPVRAWSNDKMKSIMLACVCLHNMIIEDERGAFPQDWDQSRAKHSKVQNRRDRVGRYQHVSEQYARIYDEPMHHQLQADLVEHVWNHQGGQVG